MVSLGSLDMTDPALSSPDRRQGGPSSRNKLELEGHWEDHPWELRIQRIGWIVFALLILAALAGLLGHGPLSRTTAGDPASSLRVEYQRFERYQGPTELRLHAAPQAARGGKLKIWLSREFLDNIELEQVVPQPVTAELGSDRQTYVFDAPHLTAETLVVLRYKPTQPFASVRIRAGVEGQPEVSFRQFVYP